AVRDRSEFCVNRIFNTRSVMKIKALRLTKTLLFKGAGMFLRARVQRDDYPVPSRKGREKLTDCKYPASLRENTILNSLPRPPKSQRRRAPSSI
ncbi:MAG: hypothetical protein KDD12_24145, partial [Lewinella sp.]|nr:hypothetical protein [Lewinella sp.]